MVAPVRETSAQVLATLYDHMPLTDVRNVLHLLLSMANMQEWETRHAAFLSLKYLAAIRHDVLAGVVDQLLPALMLGYLPMILAFFAAFIHTDWFASLHDTADDVRMAASDSLLSVIKSDVGITPEFLSNLVTSLWQILQDLDDITPATTSVMNLLSEIYAKDSLNALSTPLALPQQTSANVSGSGVLAVLVPRLWPFLRHVVRSVRLAVTRMIAKLVEGNPATLSSWLPKIYSNALQLIYQNFLLEAHEVRAPLATSTAP